MKLLIAILFLVGAAFGIFSLGLFNSSPTKAQLEQLSQNYQSHRFETLDALERNFMNCLSISFDLENAKFAAKFYVKGITHGIEFRSQPNLPPEGSTELEILQLSDTANFANNLNQTLTKEFSQLPKARQEEITKISDSVGRQRDYMVNCATMGAVHTLEKFNK